MPVTTPPSNRLIIVADTPAALAIDVLPTGFRGAARGMLLFGLGLCGFLTWMMVGRIQRVLPGIGGIAPLLIQVPMWIAGLGMIAAAVRLARRRASLAVAGGRLLIIETGMRREQRCEVGEEEIADLSVAQALDNERQQFMQLQLRLKSGEEQGFLTGRPVAELAWLAAALRERLAIAEEDTIAESEEDEPSPNDELVLSVESALPVNSKIQVTENVDGVTLVIPPAGIMRGLGCFLLLFATIWLGVVIPMTIALVAAGIAQKMRGWAILFFSLFWIFGMAMVGFALHAGRRRASIRVNSATIRIELSSPFGKKIREWTKDEIRTVVVGPSGLTVNNQRLPELQVHLNTGPKHGFLVGREREELNWIAGRIQRLWDE